MKPTVYLAGKMGGLTYQEMNNWRVEARELLEDEFKIINPVDFYNFEIDVSQYTNKEVKEFDLIAIRKADLILVNIEHPDSIGTAIELHMAHSEWGKPVIAFGGDLNKVHPWMALEITKHFNALHSAIEFIKLFYIPVLS